MKRKLLLMLLCAALGLGAAQAEVYRVESEADVPADWAEKDTLRLTCIDTNRSDAMVLQSGGEAMMVDSGEGRYRKRVYATLDGYGITELKYLLNTHCDDDHLHGFIYLMYSDLYQVDACSCRPTPRRMWTKRATISRRSKRRGRRTSPMCRLATATN